MTHRFCSAIELFVDIGSSVPIDDGNLLQTIPTIYKQWMLTLTVVAKEEGNIINIGVETAEEQGIHIWMDDKRRFHFTIFVGY